MGTCEIEDYFLTIGEPKLHGEMSRSLCASYVKVLMIFPDIESARPRSMSGIQALCALHIALDNTKNILQHCVQCSKLYLVITGDSVVLKFEKARNVLADSLRQVQDIVPQAIACQIAEILDELRKIKFSLDPVEKQIGDEIIVLLQQGLNFNSSSSELQSFHKAASKLGITSSKAALRERRSLKNLMERARAEENKRKESIVAYLLHLMTKYSKLFTTDFSDDNDSQESTPCSIRGSLEDSSLSGCNGCAFDRQMSSVSYKPNLRRSEQMSVPPKELRCPISLQLMYDPVIIASGLTYERVCIERWFADGHNTCPKTQQRLPRLSLTPNYSVKGLVAAWCEQNGIPIPDGPPMSLDLDYWRLPLSESDSSNSRSIESVDACKFKAVKVVPCGIIEEDKGNEEETVSAQQDDYEFGQYEEFLNILEKEDDLMKKCKVVEQIRHLLKDDEGARIYMGANGFVRPLSVFLEAAVSARNGKAQEIGAMALFNLAVNNNRNKELMLESAVLTILQKMIADTDSVGAATALYLSLSCLDKAKPIIGTTEAVPFLIRVLKHYTDVQCKLDALHTLYNISSHPTNIPHLVASGIIDGLDDIIARPTDHNWREKCMPVLNYLASSKAACDEIIAAPGLISGIATSLDVGERAEQEQAATCLLKLCNRSEKCRQIVLQEGVIIPSLALMSVNGTTRGKQKAQKLLMLFREQQQHGPSPDRTDEINVVALSAQDSKPALSKTVSRRKPDSSTSYAPGIPGDGRCLFRSVVHGACLRAGKPSPSESQEKELADELRATVADEFIKRRADTEWFVEGDFDTYVAQMRQPHVWGGEPELLMSSHVLQVPITVHMWDKKKNCLKVIAEYGQEYGRENPIRVLYHGYGHYDALQSLSGDLQSKLNKRW
ncbi:U-box domain-containing protein 45 [Sesamum alatum]|uniref:RING-type E3 ubiquitin transferase n=1 Tax=Sesamum alatum TaxID=300844 RepID=A0AAE2CJ03_9LAMI|nr:U-box domain-containing protein 45 [Sesamum alatum]